ncbi:DUF885 family protein [Micromonospora sp. BRA006-A]|nr:DUF885 family protein [Micromonospora sp. BRA006-A]
MELVTRRCRTWLDDDLALAQRYGDGPQRAALQAAAEAAREAYRRFAATLTAELAPRAHDDEAFGPSRYALWVRAFLGAEPTCASCTRGAGTSSPPSRRNWPPRREPWAAPCPRCGNGSTVPTRRASCAAGTSSPPGSRSCWRPPPSGCTASTSTSPRRYGASSHGSHVRRHRHIAPSRNLTRPGRVSWLLPDGRSTSPPGGRTAPRTTRASPATTCTSARRRAGAAPGSG